MLGGTAAKGFEDVSGGSDLSGDLGVMTSLGAEADQLMDKVALGGRLARTCKTTTKKKK